MKTVGSGETTYTEQDVEDMRAGLITLRDAAMAADPPLFAWAVNLSHCIAFMAVAKAELFKS